MKLSRDATEALILVGGFALVAFAALIVFFVWPPQVHGAWRVFVTIVVGALIVIPAMIALRRKLQQPGH